jgi:hypothetical protein
VGMGASGSGSGRKWEWAQVGITRKRRYFALSTPAHADLERATVELRQMFLAATDHILQQDESSEVGQPEHACKCTYAREHARTHARTHPRTRARTHAHAGTEMVSTPREALVTSPQISRHEVWLPTSAPGLGHPCPILTRTGLTPACIYTGNGAHRCPPTSAPGLRPDDAVSARFDFCLGETGLKVHRVPRVPLRCTAGTPSNGHAVAGLRVQRRLGLVPHGVRLHPSAAMPQRACVVVNVDCARKAHAMQRRRAVASQDAWAKAARLGGADAGRHVRADLVATCGGNKTQPQRCLRAAVAALQ